MLSQLASYQQLELHLRVESAANFTLSALEMRDRTIPSGPRYGGFSWW